MIRSLIKTGIAGALSWSGVSRLLGSFSRSRNGPAVITYHRVVENFRSSAATSIPAMLVTRATLERHLDSIGRRFRFISLDELGARLETGKDFDEPVAAVTFDDGYQDFYDLAFPLLKQKGIPAALFVVTGTVGTRKIHVHDKLYLLLSMRFGRDSWAPSDFPSFLRDLGIWLPNVTAVDAFHATRALLERLPQEEIERLLQALESDVCPPEESWRPFYSVTWEMLDEMSRNGISIGSHTSTHILMTNEPHHKVRAEAADSRQELERRLGVPIQHFAYPDGKFDAASVKAVAAAGYRFAYTTCTHRDRKHPLLTVPRTVLWENSCQDSGGEYRSTLLDCHMARVFDLFDPCRQSHVCVGGMQRSKC